MWGSLRNQVENVSKTVSKPGGVSTLISRIGEAVAPTAQSDEEYEEDEEYYDDEEEEEYYEEEEEETVQYLEEDDSSDNVKSPPPDAFSNMLAQAFDQLEEYNNNTEEDHKYVVSKSYTGNDDDGLTQEDAALEQISQSIRQELEIAASDSSLATVQQNSTTLNVHGSQSSQEQVGEDTTHYDSSFIENDPKNLIKETTNAIVVGNESSAATHGSTAKPSYDNLEEPNLQPQPFKTNDEQEFDATVSTGKSSSSRKETTTGDLSLTETHTNKEEATALSVMDKTTNDEEESTSTRGEGQEEDLDTSLDRPAILAQSIHYIRQLEDDLIQEKALSTSLQQQMADLEKQFRMQKQQMEEQFHRQSEKLQQCTDENTMLRNEKQRLDLLLKERQNVFDEGNQKQRIQYQRLLEESKRTMNQGEHKLEEKVAEMQQLQKVIGDMRSNMRATVERAKEAEEIIKELTCERDELEKELNEELDVKAALEEELEEIKRATGKVGGLQMELKMLKEETDREKEKSQSAAEAARSNLAEISAQCDAAKQEASDLERQLAAALADLELSRADYERAVRSNENLQLALESFQAEREAELSLLEEQRQHAEVALAEAHAAGIEAIKEVNEARVKEVQIAADAAIRNLMEEVKTLETSVQQYRKESNNLRRSLDEAIHRLQATQEDVIDRSLMKNILLDWHARKGQSRREVLEIMSSLLHFTDDDKVKVGLGDNGPGAFGKVVGAVAAPLPKSAVDADKIEGDSVREKWVNFLLAEVGDRDSL